MSRAPGKKPTRPVATSGAGVQRYFPGKAPEAAYDNLSASESDVSEEETHPTHARKGNLVSSEPPTRIQIQIDHRRRRRSPDPDSESRSSESDNESDEETKRLLQARMRARQLANDESSSGSESDADSEQPTSEALAARIQPQPRAYTSSEDSSTSASSDSDSSDDDDGEEDAYPVQPMLKPVFVPKSQRQSQPHTTTARSGHLDHDSQENIESARIEDERRKESVRMAAEEARRAREQPEIDDDILDLVDDQDGVDPEAEFEAWKLRELLRIKRDKEEAETIDLQEEEETQRRNMTEAERQAEGLERARRTREEKTERIRELVQTKKQEQDAQLPPPTDSANFVSERMYEYAKKKADGRHNHTKWKGYRNEDTSFAKDSLVNDIRHARKTKPRDPNGLP
ncbi:hypothetical protein LPJ53_005987 [Coemansia erecta]|uniref:Micro-fibrillar-associated protein 1 C-terminal domain-containing protein n=1 Tax=Coemansia erecta TaxID=147472 RepID=A0A9W8CMK2_9FUNG|nr:hypothetical protein LPJ53_005987 [Coemansia erecta]